MKLKLELQHPDSEVDGAVVSVNKKTAARIRHLAQIVKKEKLYMVEEFNYAAEWSVYEDDSFKPAEARVDCQTCQVTSDQVRWTGMLSDDTELATIWVAICDLPK